MIKLFHEAPKDLFKDAQSVTDGDYCLVHLTEEDEGYKKLFVDAIAQGREVILDNSIFELEEAFDMQKFHEATCDLKPTWYIIPDALEDLAATIYNAYTWKEFYADKTPGKSIGVVQGKTYEQIVDCYKVLDETVNVDMIAISFDYSLYRKMVPHSNKLVSWMMGRVALLGKLEADGIINKNKPHHLLGCGLPQEGLYYRDKEWIYSMDTSNPVVHAIKNVRYKENQGLWEKESQKLFELINYPGHHVDKKLLFYNLREFRNYWNGK